MKKVRSRGDPVAADASVNAISRSSSDFQFVFVSDYGYGDCDLWEKIKNMIFFLRLFLKRSKAPKLQKQ